LTARLLLVFTTLISILKGINEMKKGLVQCLAGIILLSLYGVAAQAAPINTSAIDFTLRDQNDNTVTLADFNGRGVILDFCTVWCSACATFYSSFFTTISGNELLVPIVMDDFSYNVSDQSDATLWGNAFGISTVLHVSGSQSIYDELVANYLDDLPLLAFPTFVFIDANLQVAGNMLGVPVSSRDLATWNGLVDTIRNSQSASVPEPPAVWLMLAALVLPLCRRRRTEYRKY